jgi:type II secretory pathway predicted ATPase ExeA
MVFFDFVKEIRQRLSRSRGGCADDGAGSLIGMYEAFFELRRRPFVSMPDLSSYVPTTVHEEAAELLLSAVNDEEGFAVLVGEPGTGKTLLCHHLLGSVEAPWSPLFITNVHSPTVQSLLQSIMYDLSSPYEGRSETELRLTIEQIEELRLLTNLAGRRERAVQVILAGQPSVLETLSIERLNIARHRIGAQATLRPLSSDEIVEYIRAQMASAGGSVDAVFTADALSELCDSTGGNPRRIHQLCHRALKIAFEQESGTVDAEHVQAAAASLAPVRQPHFEAHHATVEFEGESHSPLVEEPAVAVDAPTVVEVGAGCADDWPSTTSDSPTVVEPEPPSPGRRKPEPDRTVGSRFRRLYAR